MVSKHFALFCCSKECYWRNGSTSIRMAWQRFKGLYPGCLLYDSIKAWYGATFAKEPDVVAKAGLGLNSFITTG